MKFFGWRQDLSEARGIDAWLFAVTQAGDGSVSVTWAEVAPGGGRSLAKASKMSLRLETEEELRDLHDRLGRVLLARASARGPAEPSGR